MLKEMNKGVGFAYEHYIIKGSATIDKHVRTKTEKKGEGVLANTRISYVYSFHFQIPVLATTCTVKHHLLYLYINHLLLKATMVFVSLCFYAC
jgi:hypothetical protein